MVEMNDRLTAAIDRFYPFIQNTIELLVVEGAAMRNDDIEDQIMTALRCRRDAKIVHGKPRRNRLHNIINVQAQAIRLRIIE